MKILTYKETKLNNSVVALGKFEGLHRGHMLLVDKVVEVARERNYIPTICTIDFPVEKQINLDNERFDILEERGVELVVRCKFTKSFAELSPEEFFCNVLLEKLSAKCIVVGNDFKFGYKRKGDIDILREYGIKYGVEVLVVDKLSVDGEIVGTSLIKSNLENGNVSKVNRFLGRSYSIEGKVVKGKQLGRTIGFPTANIIPNAHKLLPAFGVYETRICFGGNNYKGLTNVGDNPTVQDGLNVTVETFVLDFTGDLYGIDIRVEFIDFVRYEMKFDSLDALVAQMNKDKETILNN